MYVYIYTLYMSIVGCSIFISTQCIGLGLVVSDLNQWPQCREQTPPFVYIYLYITFDCTRDVYDFVFISICHVQAIT